MAQVAPRSDVSSRVENYLAYLVDAMDDLIEIDASWETWDDLDQLDFVVEWDIKRDRLGQLKQWHDRGLLTTSQQDRYSRLLEIVNQRRPILDRLLAE